MTKANAARCENALCVSGRGSVGFTYAEAFCTERLLFVSVSKTQVKRPMLEEGRNTAYGACACSGDEQWLQAAKNQEKGLIIVCRSGARRSQGSRTKFSGFQT